MVNAKNLPTLLTASSFHSASSRVLHNGTLKCIASSGGLWGLSPDSDLFYLTEQQFNDIAAAGVSNGGAGPYLVIGGVNKEVQGVPPPEDGGQRWIQIVDPS